MSTGNHGREQRIRSCLACYCWWWFRNPAIKAVEVGSLPHYLQGFFYIPGDSPDFWTINSMCWCMHIQIIHVVLLQLWLVLKAAFWLNLLVICCHYSALTFMILMIYSSIIYICNRHFMIITSSSWFNEFRTMKSCWTIMNISTTKFCSPISFEPQYQR